VAVPIRADLVGRRPGDSESGLRRRIHDGSVLVVIVAVQLLWLMLLAYEAASLLT
jgi:hypothetical protein